VEHGQDEERLFIRSISDYEIADGDESATGEM
jgi:hypothetical protein